MLKRLCDLSSLFFLAAMPVVLLIFQMRGMSDPGTFWHTRVGEIILDDGFMTTDPFTFPFADQTWIPQQWGGEITMTRLYRIGGYDSLLFGFLAIFAAGFSLVFRRLMNAGMGWPLAAGVTAFAMVAAGFHFFVRPHVFTMVFTILVTAMLVDYHRGKLTFKQFLWLIPIHAVWTNLHGGMLGGLFTFALFVLDWFTNCMRHEELPPTRNWRSFIIHVGVFVACVLTMFLNPIGLELQRTWFRLIGSSTLTANIAEHSPMTLSRGGDQAVLAFGVLYMVLLIGNLNRIKDNPIWVIPIVWFLLSISSIRNGPLFVATAVVFIGDLWPNSVYYCKLRTSGDLLATPSGLLGNWHPLALLLPSMMLLAGLALQAKRIEVPLFGSGWARFDERYVPLDLTDAVRNIPPGSRIYNDANFGGFLIGTAPNLKIFMDDRFELCGDDWLRNYVEVINHHPERFDDWQRQYGFEWALIVTSDVPEQKPLLQTFIERSGRWNVVARGSIATLYRMK